MPGAAEVAVVVTACDYAAFLPECLGSLAGQTRCPDDVLVIDDASTDDTPAVLEDLRRELEGRLPLRVIRNGVRRGLSASLNQGMRETSAPRVAHVDADDRCMPEYLEALGSALDRHPDRGYAYPLMRLTGSESGIYASYPFDPARLIWEGNYIPNVGLVRRDAYASTPGYRDLPTHVDWDFWLSMLEAGWSGVLVDEVLYEWRRHPGAMTYQSSTVRLRARLAVLSSHRSLLVRHARSAVPWTSRAVRRRLRPDRAGAVRTPSGWVHPEVTDPHTDRPNRNIPRA